MLVSWHHAADIFEIGCEFLEFDHIVRFYVVPAPYELSENLFF